ncbi:MAG: CRISPR-associated endonuclease Cas1 [Deltaproteobacteria bacterium]|nr:CRISPR-associated endonuclease Cas1 [Deltaproteobacteria bacterium]
MPTEDNVESLRGLEGMASKIYFSVFDKGFKNFFCFHNLNAVPCVKGLRQFLCQMRGLICILLINDINMLGLF